MEPQRLNEFRSDCESLEPDAFGTRHGEAFLLHHGPIGEAAGKAKKMLRTQMVEAKPGGSGNTGKPEFLIFPVKQTGRSPFPFFISVGRTDNNDIVIRDASLSKFHAYFKHEDGGTFLIQDGGSSNGTFVNDAKVPKKEEGDPLEIRSGARLRFGRVELTFLELDEFRSMVKSGS